MQSCKEQELLCISSSKVVLDSFLSMSFMKTFFYLSFLAWNVLCAILKAVHIKVN